MNAKISGVFFIRRQSTGSTVEPQVFAVEDGGNSRTEPTVTTMSDSVRPLLTSMKLFGLYFKCETKAGDTVTEEGSHRRWNGNMIYGLVVAIIMWINAARMFSVFTADETLGPLFFFKFTFLLWNILNANSQTTFFAACCSGRLEHVLDSVKLSGACSTFSQRVAVVYASVAWAMILVNAAFASYSVFFAEGDMDITMAPITIHVNLFDLLIPRVVMYLFSFHHTAA